MTDDKIANIDRMIKLQKKRRRFRISVQTDIESVMSDALDDVE